MSDPFQSYVFASSNEPGLIAASSLESLEGVCDQFFAVALANDEELELLMRLLGIRSFSKTTLPANDDFTALFDYSDTFLPQLNCADFDVFYRKWLRLSGRESTMDEYGQLVFLQGHAVNWNTKSYRFVLLEKV
jgi:hypothetical protein